MTSPQLPEMKSLESMGFSSSNIKSVAHQDDNLYVQFNSGATWKYSGVPATVYDEMIHAGSIGTYFAKNVKPHYAAEKIEHSDAA